MTLYNINKLANKPLKLALWGDNNQALFTSEALEAFKTKLSKADQATLTAADVDPAAAAAFNDFEDIITLEDI